MESFDNLNKVLEKQKKAHLRDGALSVETRKEWIDRCIALLIKYQNEIVEAISKDFGHRSTESSLLADVAGSIGSLKSAKENIKKWVKPEKRKVTPAILGLLGAKLRVEYQPLGTVGVISPWNFPVTLTFGPLGSIFAAGNRAMIKPSEFTPETSKLMKVMFEEAFKEEEVAVFTGGPDLGEAFSSLPFDHLLFTGATSIAKHVMRAASENLVPVTLELGGKSPVIISKNTNFDMSVKRVMAGKTMNAGQICLAPDYVFIPKDKKEEFISQSKKTVTEMYPSLKDNPDYTSVINQRHYDRLQGYVDEAKEKGFEVIEINPSNEDFSQQAHHKIPPTLIVDPDDNLSVMKEEIFGPILSVKTYEDIEDTVDYINSNDRPLGLYYFGDDKKEMQNVLENTTSGGVTINDVVFHVGQDNAPFGGVGPSGTGSYHGIEGFKNFSHTKTIYTQSSFDGLFGLFRPPFGAKAKNAIKGQIKA
ncbi:MAG: coniferyl aldehyde dehydrogenase [Alphaproteobacteria bacterium]|jgi:coniferyl-aldehyde dehydrogenase|nr:MAG: coniferyl aldehyde dehydrogenase [alpha proteobacterium MED-G09]|tara:strand:+ start:3251 stop:4678 length:1428 start_codon:yes stop_codon:yes gene_type:complete